VVGVHLARREFDIKTRGNAPAESDEYASKDVIEVSLTGTAVRYGGRINMERPLLSTLTGEEFLTLRAAGHMPVGIVYGCCVWYQAVSQYGGRGNATAVPWGTQWQNQEIYDYSRGVKHAQQTAVRRPFAPAQGFGARGVLDAQFTSHVQETEHDIQQYENEHKQAGIIVTVEAIGTAVVEVDPAADPPVSAILPLS